MDLLFARNDSTHTPSLRGLEKPVAISVWDTRTVKQNSSLRGFEKAMAISVWDTRTVKQNSSLQEFRTCGNLSMGYNY